MIVKCLKCVISPTDEDDYRLGSCGSPAHYYQWVFSQTHSHCLNSHELQKFSQNILSLFQFQWSCDIASVWRGGRGGTLLPLLPLSLSISLSSAHSPPLPLGGARQPPTPSSVSACVPFEDPASSCPLVQILSLAFPHKSAVRSVLRLWLIPLFWTEREHGRTGEIF